MLHRAPALLPAIALMLGIMAGNAVYGVLPSWLPPAATALLLAVAVGFLMRPRLCSALLVAATFSLGVWLIDHSLQRSASALPGGETEYYAVVVGEPSVHGRVLMFDMIALGPRHLHVRASLLRDTVSNRWAGLGVGSGFQASSVVERGRYGRGYTTFIYYSNWHGCPVLWDKLTVGERVELAAMRWRSHLLSLLGRAGLTDEGYAIVAAMALGDKSHLSRDLRATYSAVGASHVLALSGLHLGIIYFVLSLFVGFVRPRWLGESIILLTIWAFVVLVGMSPSVVRSAVMVTIYSAARLTRRSGSGLNIVAFTALVMLVLSPQALFDVGFQLSFLSVAAITVMYPVVFGLLPVADWYRHRLLSRLWGMVVVTLCAQVATAPLVAYYFGTISTCFLLTSFVVIPAATVIVYGAMAVLATSFSAVVSGWLAVALGRVVSLENSLLQLIASLPGSSVQGLHPSVAQTVLTYVVIGSLFAVLCLTVRKKEAMDETYY